MPKKPLKLLKISLICVLLAALPACGYRFGRSDLLQRYHTVCIPYVEGDNEGLLTAELIRSVTTRGALAYRSNGAQLRLKVCLFAPEDTNIGFIYAPNEDDEPGISKVITANEGRLSLTAAVTLIDCCSGECILGPLEITSTLDYDFEPDLSDVNENAFSLGQLEMHGIAVNTATPPLYTLLAEKIVDYVNNCW